MSVWSQETDTTTINRTVVVERAYKPIIKSAGKIAVKPQIKEVSLPPVEVTYSTYTQPFKTDFNISPLNFATVNFLPPTPMDGLLRVGVGHTQTQFDFNYQVRDKKDVIFDIHANHLGHWGIKTMSNSALGFDFSKLFNNADVFFGIEGKNHFFTRYGQYFDYTDTTKMMGQFNDIKKYSDFKEADIANQWEVNTKIGVRSILGKDIQYLVQTGYEAFIMTENIAEHIVNSQLALEWNSNHHAAGAKAMVNNIFYTADMADFAWSQSNIARGDTVAAPYHAFKIEPYYAYDGKRFRIHAGVNLDFCWGKGDSTHIFKPSPNVTFEAQLTDDWLALYGGAQGQYQTNSAKKHFSICRYLHPENEIATTRPRSYIPVDAFLGFKMRPQANLLIDIYAHYILTKNQVYLTPDSLGYFNLTGGNHNQWKVGGKITYHYRDIVNIALDGFYAFGTMMGDSIMIENQRQAIETLLPKGHILDKPTWGINLRVNTKINNKLSLYSDNYFNGGRYVLGYVNGTLQVLQLKPIIDLNLGIQYNINKWFTCYLQLNNYLNRKHDIYYHYQSQGINFMTGITYSF